MLADRFAIARALREMGQLLRILGASRFRAQAYLKAASALEIFSGDLSRLIQEKRLLEIPGIGNALAAQIAEIAATGGSTFLDSLRSELPPGVVDLVRVPGLTLKSVTALHDALGIASLDDLRAACEGGRVRNVKGFGEKTERKILEAIARRTERRSRAGIHQAEVWAQHVLEHVRASPSVVRAEVAGSLRRALPSDKNPVTAYPSSVLRYRTGVGCDR